MAWFQKKPDPISDHARELDERIASLESQIQELGDKVQKHQAHPRLRPPALPHGHLPAAAGAEPVPPQPPPPQEPIFEEIDQNRLQETGAESAASHRHYNELGVRKYDLPALVQRIRNHFRGPATTNPKLVSYLAAGGIQGLRPLRYEKRVARNRFIGLVVVLFVILLGLIAAFLRHHNP